MSKLQNQDEIWTQDINKHTDWGGDESTSYLPVAGEKVQKFIKNQLNSKAGYFWLNQSTGECYAFTDQESCEQYLSDPIQYQDLLLGKIGEEIAQYTAQITLDSPQIQRYYKLGTKNISIDFTFVIVDKNNQDTYENVIVDYKISNGSTRYDTITRNYSWGSHVSFNVDQYLLEGKNEIIIELRGAESLATTRLRIDVNLVTLQLSSGFDFTTPKGQEITVPFSTHVKLDGSYNIKAYINNHLVGTSNNYTDSIEGASLILSGFNQYINDGRNILQLRAETEINEEMFYSNTLYYEFIIRTSELPLTTSLIATQQENMAIPLVIRTEQFEELNFDWAIYDSNEAAGEVSISFDGVSLYNGLDHSGTITYIPINPVEEGIITIIFNEMSFTYHVIVQERTDINITKDTTSLIAEFIAQNNSNTSSTRNIWKYHNYTGAGSDVDLDISSAGLEWTVNSGWDGNHLVLNEGNVLTIPIKLFQDWIPAQGGKTLEITFNTFNVKSRNVPIVQVGNNIQITANSAVFTDGVNSIDTKFNEGKEIKLAFIVNSSSTHLMFIINNGVLDRAIKWQNSSGFNTSSNLVLGCSSGCGIKISSIRIYDRAITEESELNNYILDGGQEAFSRFERNNILNTNKEIDIEAVSNYLPVMVIKTDQTTWNTYMSFRNKKDHVNVDVEYINKQNTTYNFQAYGISLRKQGTSSLNYPIPNIRVYFNKDTISVEGHDERVVGDRITKSGSKYYYAFKDKSLPVDCWTLKADFAESSMTHNTGVARLWNNVFKNAIVNTGGYTFDTNGNKITEGKGALNPCSTNAQRDSKATNKDIRTTIDGFPIVVYYYNINTNQYTFVGQYNFDNDKSTEAVFGFTPENFTDGNTKVECWEVLDSGRALALMIDDDFDAKETSEGEEYYAWERAYEGRYPDGNTNITNLRTLVSWVCACYNGGNYDHTKFNDELDQHLDVWKVAAYYVYLMRFGAVDQTVKNSMITTEDGIHWYFINYDNDTILGVRNDGKLVFDYTIDRQSKQSDGVSYVYAGHDSALWNLLEANSGFMDKVKVIDQSLYSAGLTYENVIKMFNEDQAGKWSEVIYNKSQRYKYLDTNDRQQYLANLQGNRISHREWWLSNRFALYDAKFGNGAYANKFIKAKLNSYPKDGGNPLFDVVPSEDFIFAWGENGRINESLQVLKGIKHTFYTSGTGTIEIGSPVGIYAPQKIEELNLGYVREKITELQDLDEVYGEVTGSSNLKRLYLTDDTLSIGHNTQTFTTLNLGRINSLEELNVSGYENLNSISGLDNQLSLNIFKADDTKLVSFVPAVGVKLSQLILPQTISTLSLKSAEIQSYTYTPNNTLVNLELDNVTGIDTRTFVSDWISTFNNDYNRTLTLKGFRWGFGSEPYVTVTFLKELGKIANKNLSGVVRVQSLSSEDAQELRALFGNNVFNRNSQFYITSVETLIFVTATGTTLTKLSDVQYSAEVLQSFNSKFAIDSLPEINFVIGLTNGILGEDDRHIPCYINRNSGNILYLDGTFVANTGGNSKEYITFTGGSVIITIELTLKSKIPPTGINFTIAEPVISKKGTYEVTYDYTPANINIPIDSVELTTNVSSEYVLTSINKDTKKITLEVLDTLDADLVLTVNTLFKDGSSYSFDSPRIIIVKDEILYSDEFTKNPYVYNVLKSNESILQQMETTTEDIETAGGIYRSQVKKITSLPQNLFRNNTLIQNFDTLKEFSNLTTIGNYCFSECTGLRNISFPESLITIGEGAFYGCTISNKVEFASVESLLNIYVNPVNNSFLFDYYIYINGQRLNNLEIPAGITTNINHYAFWPNYNSIKFPENFTLVGSIHNALLVNIPNSLSVSGNLHIELPIYESVSFFDNRNFLQGRNGLSYSILDGIYTYNDLEKIDFTLDYSDSENVEILKTKLTLQQNLVFDNIGDYALENVKNVQKVTINGSIASQSGYYPIFYFSQINTVEWNTSKKIGCLCYGSTINNLIIKSDFNCGTFTNGGSTVIDILTLEGKFSSYVYSGVIGKIVIKNQQTWEQNVFTSSVYSPFNICNDRYLYLPDGSTLDDIEFNYSGSENDVNYLYYKVTLNNVDIIGSAVPKYCFYYSDIQNLTFSGNNINIGAYAFYSEYISLAYFTTNISSIEDNQKFRTIKLDSGTLDWFLQLVEGTSYFSYTELVYSNNPSIPILEIHIPSGIVYTPPLPSNMQTNGSVYLPSTIKRNIKEAVDKVKNIYLENMEMLCEMEYSSIYETLFRSLRASSYSNNLYIGGIQFNWDSVTSITIPEGVTEINKLAFFGLFGGPDDIVANVVEVNLPSTLQKINERAFASINTQYKANTKINFGNISNSNILEIDRAFQTNGNGSSVKLIFNFKSLEDIFKVKRTANVSSTTSLYYKLYINNVETKSITTPSSITSIPDYCLYRYDELEDVTIGDQVTLLGTESLDTTSDNAVISIGTGVSSLNGANVCGKRIVLKDNITSINTEGDITFPPEFYIYSTTPPTIITGSESWKTSSNPQLHVPAGSATTYETVWGVGTTSSDDGYIWSGTGTQPYNKYELYQDLSINV